MIDFVTNLQQALDECKILLCVFIDFEKAFNTSNILYSVKGEELFGENAWWK